MKKNSFKNRYRIGGNYLHLYLLIKIYLFCAAILLILARDYGTTKFAIDLLFSLAGGTILILMTYASIIFDLIYDIIVWIIKRFKK